MLAAKEGQFLIFQDSDSNALRLAKIGFIEDGCETVLTRPYNLCTNGFFKASAEDIPLDLPNAVLLDSSDIKYFRETRGFRLSRPFEYFWMNKEQLNKKFVYTTETSSSSSSIPISNHTHFNPPPIPANNRPSIIQQQQPSNNRPKSSSSKRVKAAVSDVISITSGNDDFCDTPQVVDIAASEYENRMNRIKNYLNPSLAVNKVTSSSSSSSLLYLSSSSNKVQSEAVPIRSSHIAYRSPIIPNPNPKPRVRNSTPSARISNPHTSSTSEATATRRKRLLYDESILQAPEDHDLVTFESTQKRMEQEGYMKQSTETLFHSSSHNSTSVNDSIPITPVRVSHNAIPDIYTKSFTGTGPSINTTTTATTTATATTNATATTTTATNLINVSTVSTMSTRRVNSNAFNSSHNSDTLFDSTAVEEVPLEDEPIFMWAESETFKTNKFVGYKENRFIVYHCEEPIDPLPSLSSSSASASAITTTRAAVASRACQYKLHLGRIGAKEDFMAVAFVKPYVVEHVDDGENLATCRCTSDEDMVIVNFENAVLVSHTDLFYDRLLKVYRMIGTLDLLWTRGLSALKMKQEARIVKQNVKVDRTYQDDYLHGDIDTDKKKKKKKHPKGVRWSDSNSDNLRSSPSDVRDISDVISPKLKNGKISSDYTSDGKKRKWLAPVGSASMQHSSNHSSLSHTAGLLHTKTMSHSGMHSSTDPSTSSDDIIPAMMTGRAGRTTDLFALDVGPTVNPICIPSTLPYIGVKMIKLAEKRYAAFLNKRGKDIKVSGLYDSSVEAAVAYDQAALKYFGPDALTNFTYPSRNPIIEYTYCDSIVNIAHDDALASDNHNHQNSTSELKGSTLPSQDDDFNRNSVHKKESDENNKETLKASDLVKIEAYLTRMARSANLFSQPFGKAFTTTASSGTTATEGKRTSKFKSHIAINGNEDSNFNIPGVTFNDESGAECSSNNGVVLMSDPDLATATIPVGENKEQPKAAQSSWWWDKVHTTVVKFGLH